MAEEEASIEVEAAESVYGDDCVVLSQSPPHLQLLIKPRTADVSSQQFVEAVIGIRASSKYPDEPPEIMIIDSKGLDEQRQNHLITSIHNKACELSSNSMLVALCEEAVEKLTSMNHPDGDCPLCLSPLVEDGASNNAQPFMKLMSCFHCFHCECIIRWWNWLQMNKEVNHATSSGQTAHAQKIKTQTEMHKKAEERMGICPVCRKVFHGKDIEHVLDLVGAYSQLGPILRFFLTTGTKPVIDSYHRDQICNFYKNLDETKSTENEMVLNSDSENTRRKKFEATMKLQQENNGLIEPKKTEVLMPGMYLPRPATTTTSAAAATGEQATESKVEAGGPANKPSSSRRRSSGPRSNYRGRNSRTQVNRQWVVKDNGNA